MNGRTVAPRRIVAAFGIAACLGLAAFGGYRWVTAADHRDSMTLTNDKPADIADVYSFRSPGNQSNVVLAMTVSGLMAPSESGFFDPNVLYQFRIDTNGDAVEDRVIQAFATGAGASQTIHFRGPAAPQETGATSRILEIDDAATVQISTGETAITASGGGLTVFAGLRDDPFYFDLAQFQAIVAGTATGFRDPGIDAFAGTNVLAIVVEMPASALGGTDVRVWGTTSRII